MNPSPPTEQDFSGCPDGVDAWKNFGGLTIDQASAKFDEAPSVYQEDFMFMGPVAFAFYFPVVDRFLRETANLSEEERDDGRESWILSRCIRTHFKEKNRHILKDVVGPVLELCTFMESNIDLFIEDWDPPSENLRSWRALRETVFRFKTESDAV